MFRIQLEIDTNNIIRMENSHLLSFFFFIDKETSKNASYYRTALGMRLAEVHRVGSGLLNDKSKPWCCI